MASTINWKVYTGSPLTEAPGTGSSAVNVNLLLQDIYDDTAGSYAANPISVPSAGSNYSFERVIRAQWTGTYNEVTNVKLWRSSGTLSDAGLAILADVTGTWAPAGQTSGASTFATAAIPTTSGTALDATPAAGSAYPAAGYSKYGVMQLLVKASVTTPGDIGSQLIRFQWDET